MRQAIEIAFDPQFLPSLHRLDPVDSQRVLKTVSRYQQAPDASGLNLEQLEGRGGRRRLWTIRASKELRVLLAREGPASVLLRAGHHDAIYDFASRVAFAAPLTGRPGLIPVRPDAIDLDGSVLTPTPGPAGRTAEAEPSILAHWSDRELAGAGFDSDAVRRLRRATQGSLLEVWPELLEDEVLFDKISACSEQSPEAWANRRLIDDQETEHRRFRDAIMERGARAGLSSLLGRDELERLLSAPIEEWMIFLHPDQRTLVERRFAGPARVSGSAGTGKTVVALHRAAALAKRFTASRMPPKSPPPVLFTTFIKNLPPVFDNLYRRLPTAVAGAVEFINVDKLASRFCHEAESPPALNPAAVEAAFDDAWAAVLRPGTPLYRVGLTRGYLRDEVTAVLKGRGIDTLEEYQRVERTGRRTRFTAAMREQAWALREAWDERLAERGVEDFPDVVRRARDLVRERSEPRYRAAIVDESQDLTLVGLQFIQTLVNGPGMDGQDGLFLVGDHAQKIYPGGFTLVEAGVDVRGRGAVLRINYRNTRPIIGAAMACAGSERVDDDEGGASPRSDAAHEALRGGPKPVLVRVADAAAQVAFVVDEVKRLTRSGNIGGGDIGVFAPDRNRTQQALKGLRAADLRCQSLSQFDGKPNDAIKVDTFHRAKGLEFKAVFLLGTAAFPRPRSAQQTDAEYAEQRAMQVSQLFVAMTRARDRLFVLCKDHPSDVLSGALAHFEERDGRP